MPIFGDSFQPPQTPSLPSNLDPRITAQVQQFKQKQEHLWASTHRRIQQEVESARQQYREIGNLLGPSFQIPLPDSYTPHHRASFPTDHASSSRPDMITKFQAPVSKVPAYSQTPTPGSGHSEIYNYTQDASEPFEEFAYAASLTTPIRYPPAFEMDSRRRFTLPVGKSPQPNIAKGDLNASLNPNNELETSSRTTIPVTRVDSRSPRQGTRPLESIGEYESQLQQNQGFNQSSQPEQSEMSEELVTDAFSSLEKMFDQWDAGDNEWLYTLQTECAKPGAICECGDSCCCPGCFTHTNNLGDRGVYNTVINKMGSISGSDKEGQGSGGTKPCLSTSTKPVAGGADGKL